MILLIILSIILIWLHISSLRLMIRTRGGQAIALKDVSEMEEKMQVSGGRDSSVGIMPVIMSIGVVFFLNLIEIGYFIFCVYYFNDHIIVIGSSVLVGYSLYSIFKFVPKMKEFIKKPLSMLTEKTEEYERLINIVMVSLEILFCIYILFKIVLVNLKG
jgi:hypothetical protein